MKKTYADLDTHHEIETQNTIMKVEMDGWLTVDTKERCLDEDDNPVDGKIMLTNAAFFEVCAHDAGKLALVFAELAIVLEKKEEKELAGRIKERKAEEKKTTKKKPGPKKKTTKKKPGPKPKGKKKRTAKKKVSK